MLVANALKITNILPCSDIAGSFTKLFNFSVNAFWETMCTKLRMLSR